MIISVQSFMQHYHDIDLDGAVVRGLLHGTPADVNYFTAVRSYLLWKEDPRDLHVED